MPPAAQLHNRPRLEVLALGEPESLLREVAHFAVRVLDSEDELASRRSPDIDDCAASTCSEHLGSWREDCLAHTSEYAGARQRSASPARRTSSSHGRSTYMFIREPTMGPTPGQMPLEGLEHDLSILHSDVKRQIPRNYAAFRDLADIQRRLKTASWKWNAGKTRAKLPCQGATIRRMPKTNAGKSVFASRDLGLI